MAMKSGFTYAALLSVIITVAGCASLSRSKTTQVINSGKPVSLAIIYVTTASAMASSDDVKQGLNDAVVSRLNESKMFATVTDQPPDASLGQGIKIVMEIKHLKKVSQEARDWTGVMAGRAAISIQTTITDLQSGRPIQSFEVEAESGRAAYAETTSEAINQAAEQIVSEVLKLNAQLAKGELL
jgi:uncharacterized lipoprotein YmbA